MKRVLGILVGLLVAALVIAPVLAQDDPGAGNGSPIINANLGSDIATLNPILINDGSSAAVAARLFPTLIGVDVKTGTFSPVSKDAPLALTTGWTISDDGLTYTFKLRDDWNWSDGTPITAADYKYAFDAIKSGQTNSPLGYVLDTIDDVQATDDHTVTIKVKSVDCSALSNINAVPVVPAHVYEQQFKTYKDMNDATDFNLNPTVTAGSFTFANFRPGEQVTLKADQNDPDTQLGHVVPQGWIYKNVADENLILEQFKAGDLTIGTAPEDRQNELRQMGKDGQAQVYEYPTNNLRFISFNLADPKNPQNGLDDKGNVIDQGHHPILGDVRVRQALMYAMDWNELNQKAMGGEGVQLAAPTLPISWAFDKDIKPYPFDLDKANQLLTEAGWIDDDNNPDTPRVAKGAMYAPDGTKLAFKLETNSGNVASESIGVLLQDQWKKVGVDLDFQTIDFNVLIQDLQGQTYDAVMLFWNYSTPDNPEDLRATFDPHNDVVSSGFNVSSYNNPDVNKLMDQAKTVPGCDQTKRAALYGQVNQILHDDVPWIWVNSNIAVVAAPEGMANWDPTVTSRQWNEDAWFLPSDHP